MFRPSSNGWKWSRSPAISRSGGEVASPRCYTRRTGLNSLNLPGSGKWTSTSPAPTVCVIGPARRTSNAKLTASIAECGSGRHSASSPATTGKNQREHNRGQGIPGPVSERPGANETSSSPGALHDFDGSSTRLLVPARSHRQGGSSGDPM